MEAYFDNAATTKCSDAAKALMARVLCEDYGNPSSLHRKGMEGEAHLREAAGRISKTPPWPTGAAACIWLPPGWNILPWRTR